MNSALWKTKNRGKVMHRIYGSNGYHDISWGTLVCRMDTHTASDICSVLRNSSGNYVIRMFKINSNWWLLVLGAALFANSCYFAYAYVENFGSFNSQHPNYLLAIIYASNSMFVFAGLFGGRKKHSPDFVRMGKIAAVCLFLYAVVLIMYFYFWKLGLFVSGMNVFISAYFVVLAVKLKKGK